MRPGTKVAYSSTLAPAVVAALLAWFVQGWVTAVAEERPASARKPNFVFILADDWGWGDLGCYGHRQLKTPNLDRMARQGVLFTQFYVCSGVCSPSRTAFMTGHFPARHSIHGHLATPQQNAERGMPNFLDPAVPTVTRLLQKAGYVTGHFGKWHLGHNPGAPEPSAYGLDVYRSLVVGNGPELDRTVPHWRARSSQTLVDDTIQFIEANRGRPFYVQTWLLDTHATLDPTEEQMKPYNRYAPGDVSHKGAMQIYYAAATAADAQIGRLLDKLDELGLAENTVVIFSSDNGPEEILISNASHSGIGSPGPFRGRKRSLYEGGVRLPFIVRWPTGSPAGRVDSTTVLSAVDFLPSLCRLAGVALAADVDLDGEDMSAALRGQPAERAKPLMWEWRFGVYGHVLNRSPMLSIRQGRWKLLMNPDRSRVELYDIPADPSELNNLADRHSEVVARLSERLLAWQATLPKGPVEPAAGANDYPWPQPGKR